MYFEELRYFMTVAKYRNFTKAANELYISQPTLSKKIAKLEKFLGIQLFIRTRRSVQLTEAGNILNAEGKQLLQHIDRVLNMIKSSQNSDIMQLNVAILGAIDIKFLPMIKHFTKQYPKIKLSLTSNSVRQMHYLLEEGLADIIITLDFGTFLIPDIHVKKIYSEGVSLVVPSEHWFVKSDEQDFTKLCDEKFVLFSAKESPHSYEQIKRICASWGFVPKGQREVESLSSALFAIAAGGEISILPNHAKRYATDDVKFLPIDDETEALQIVAAWKKRNINPAISLFLDKLLL